MDVTDNSLISLIIEENDMKAFNKLMKRYEEAIYRMALMYCKERESAYDIVQNTFIKVYENLNSFRGDSSFKTWLYKICYYEALNWIRKNKKSSQFTDVNEMENYLQLDFNSDDLVLKGEKYKILKNGITKLNKKYQTVLYLKYFDNLSLKEIAEIINTTEGTIKNILFRSVRKLNEILTPSMEEA